MRQLNVALPDSERAELEAAAKGAGRSVAQELRQRLESLKVGLPDDLRKQLDIAAAAAGHSLGEEIRLRLWWTFAEHVSPTDLVGAAERFNYENAWLTQQ